MEAFDGLRADIARNRTAIKVADPATKKALGEIWDWLEGYAEAVDEIVGDQAEVIDEIIEQEEELLHGDTAQALIETMTLGSKLLDRMKGMIPPGDPAHEEIARFGIQTTELIARIGEITVPDGDPAETTEGEEEVDDEGDDEGDEEDDDVR